MQYPLADDTRDQPGDIVRFPDGTLGTCIALDSRYAKLGRVCYVARRNAPHTAETHTLSPQTALAARAAVTNATPPLVAAAPDPERLRKSLLSYFQHRDGWCYCKPLNQWHMPDVPFLCGYATTWGTATNDRYSANTDLAYRIVVRRGAFSDVLHSRECVEAWLCHRAHLSLGSTTNKTVAILEDEHGLAVFVDATKWNHGEALADSIADGELCGMSFQHIRLRGKCIGSDPGGARYVETLAVAGLPEVSFTHAPANASTVALAVNHRSGVPTFARANARRVFSSLIGN